MTGGRRAAILSPLSPGSDNEPSPPHTLPGWGKIASPPPSPNPFSLFFCPNRAPGGLPGGRGGRWGGGRCGREPGKRLLLGRARREGRSPLCLFFLNPFNIFLHLLRHFLSLFFFYFFKFFYFLPHARDAGGLFTILSSRPAAQRLLILLTLSGQCLPLPKHTSGFCSLRALLGLTQREPLFGGVSLFPCS